MGKRKSFVNYILWRYLRFDRKHPFIYISFILSFLGVMTGVATLMIAMGILNGMDGELRKKLQIMEYPITIYAPQGELNSHFLQKLETHFPNYKFSPYLETTAVVQSGGELKGLILYGVDFKREKEINPILKKGVEEWKQPIGLFDVVVGKKLFDWLGVQPGGKTIFIFSRLSPMGFSVEPLFKKVRIIGYFQSGLSSFDWGIGYMDIRGLKRILNQPYFDGIHIWTPNPFKDIEKIRKFLPKSFTALGWWQQNKNFFAALKLEKTAIFLVLMLIVLVASLNIISSLLMMVMSRRKEIALMLSLGASPLQIRKIFLRMGILIGIGGIVVGSLIGFGINWILSHYQIVDIPKGVYGVDKLVVDLSWRDYLLIVGGTFLITLLSSLYPAYKASKIDVLETLRYE